MVEKKCVYHVPIWRSNQSRATVKISQPPHEMNGGDYW